MHVLLVEFRGEQFDVSSSTVDALLVFHGELDDQRLTLVAEVIKPGRRGVEVGILARLQTCRRTRRTFSCHASGAASAPQRSPLTFIFLAVSVELPCSQDQLAVVRLVLGFYPATLPGICRQVQGQLCTKQGGMNLKQLLMLHWSRCGTCAGSRGHS